MLSAWGEGTGDRLKAETYCDFSLEGRWKLPVFPHSSYSSHGPHPSAALMKTLVGKKARGRARMFKRRMEGKAGEMFQSIVIAYI